MKDIRGRIVNSLVRPKFTFGKELQLHVMEIKPNAPFASPVDFEETMQEAVSDMQDFVHRRYEASLLGTGMHPLMKLKETEVWSHRHMQIYEAYSKIFNLRQHGWLNIQSFQLNLPYSTEKDGILLHNLLANVCAYLPAITASSPFCEGKHGEDMDNRLSFYEQNQREVPSITGDVVPEYVSSFGEYRAKIIEKYSLDLAAAGADQIILNREWVNSRGVIFRFDRRALEVRVMDEQECVKSDVALGCFVRAVLRGLMKEKTELLPHGILAEDFSSVVKNGLGARTRHPNGRVARQVCEFYLQVAFENATEEEKGYLSLIRKRLEKGNLSEIIRERIKRKTQRTNLREAIINVYSRLINSLQGNQPYF